MSGEGQDQSPAAAPNPGLGDAAVAARPYPGSEATVGQLLSLADQFYVAAMTLTANPANYAALAPTRFCAIHAIEIYLNAFLRFRDVPIKQLRGLQHDLAERMGMAISAGLFLRAKTREHILRMNDRREYLVVRYGPEQSNDLSEMNRVLATLKDVSSKIRATILNQPYDQADPRFKKYW